MPSLDRWRLVSNRWVIFMILALLLIFIAGLSPAAGAKKCKESCGKTYLVLDGAGVEECKSPQRICTFWLKDDDGKNVKYTLYGQRCRTCDEGTYYKHCVKMCLCDSGDCAPCGEYDKEIRDYKKCTIYKFDASTFYTVPPLP